MQHTCFSCSDKAMRSTGDTGTQEESEGSALAERLCRSFHLLRHNLKQNPGTLKDFSKIWETVLGGVISFGRSKQKAPSLMNYLSVAGEVCQSSVF